MLAATTRRSLPPLAGSLLVVCTAFLGAPLRAEVTQLTVQLRPNSPEGAGFGVFLLDIRDLDVTLAAPKDSNILDTPPPSVRDSGSPFWVPAPNNPKLPATSFGFQVIGIRRDDDHGVGFKGYLAGKVSGKFAVTKFDAAVADLQFAAHQMRPSDNSGLSLPSGLWTGPFPAQLPANSGYGTNFTVTPHWGGSGGGAVGYVTFTDNTAAGVALYDNGNLLQPGGLDVPAGGLPNATLMVLTNENFTAGERAPQQHNRAPRALTAITTRSTIPLEALAERVARLRAIANRQQRKWKKHSIRIMCG